MLGSFAGGPLVGRIRIPRLYGGSLAVLALGIGGAAASPNVWVAAACCAVAGVGNGAAIVCNALLVQRGAPDELRGRAFTVIFSVNYLVLGAGMALAGVTNDALGPRWTWAIASGTLAVAALAGWVLTARIGEARPARLEPQQQVSPEAVEARQ